MRTISPTSSPDASAAVADRLDTHLQTMAEVVVHVGLGLAHGQQLLITAPLEALALVRKITEAAYKAGASLVTTMFVDDQAVLARYKYADEESFDTAAGWLYDGIAEAYRWGPRTAG